MGFPAVLRHVRKHITSSVWFSIFNNAAPAEHGWTIERETANGIFADFVGKPGRTRKMTPDLQLTRRSYMF